MYQPHKSQPRYHHDVIVSWHLAHSVMIFGLEVGVLAMKGRSADTESVRDLGPWHTLAPQFLDDQRLISVESLARIGKRDEHPEQIDVRSIAHDEQLGFLAVIVAAIGMGRPTMSANVCHSGTS
jgi:hypothetical protein